MEPGNADPTVITTFSLSTRRQDQRVRANVWRIRRRDPRALIQLQALCLAVCTAANLGECRALLGLRHRSKPNLRGRRPRKSTTCGARHACSRTYVHGRVVDCRIGQVSHLPNTATLRQSRPGLAYMALVAPTEHQWTTAPRPAQTMLRHARKLTPRPALLKKRRYRSQSLRAAIWHVEPQTWAGSAEVSLRCSSSTEVVRKLTETKRPKLIGAAPKFVNIAQS